MKTRIESDVLGSVEIPDTLCGLYTNRVENLFREINSPKVPAFFFRNFIKVKKCYSVLNHKHGKLQKSKQKAIFQACTYLEKLSDFELTELYPVKQIQNGGGTGTNMAANEIIANKALEILGEKYGSYSVISAYDHVNMSQSSNDTFPAVSKISIYQKAQLLIKTLKHTAEILTKKSKEWKNIKKVGRTHLQDAIEMTLGDEFSSFAVSIQDCIEMLEKDSKRLLILSLGATALGSLQNVTKDMRKDIVEIASKEFEIEFQQTKNYFKETSTNLDISFFMNALRPLLEILTKLGNDLRILASGPLAGIAEINLPSKIPGSSIMPGKVNPSVVETMQMIVFKAFGALETLKMAVVHSQLQLQVFNPILVFESINALELLDQGLRLFNKDCLTELAPNLKNIQANIAKSNIEATKFSEKLGYQKVAGLVHEALDTEKKFSELVK